MIVIDEWGRAQQIVECADCRFVGVASKFELVYNFSLLEKALGVCSKCFKEKYHCLVCGVMKDVEDYQPFQMPHMLPECMECHGRWFEDYPKCSGCQRPVINHSDFEIFNTKFKMGLCYECYIDMKECRLEVDDPSDWWKK